MIASEKHQNLVRDAAILLPDTLESMSKAKYIEWLADSEEMYGHFRTFALRVLRSGRERFSVYTIRERVRWEVNIEWSGDYKISNNLTPYIARTLVIEFPELVSVLSFKGEVIK